MKTKEELLDAVGYREIEYIEDLKLEVLIDIRDLLQVIVIKKYTQ